MPLASGTKLGSYEIVAPLGAGGMGEVYRAHDSRLGRDVALKILPAAFASDADRLARFEREARTLAGINHPNIVVLHTIEESAGSRFITMELVEGKSLDQEIPAGGFPLPRFFEIAFALADALVGAHEKGVVHRDLKPANVMTARDGRIKVLDFGLARPVAGGGSSDFTRAITLESPVSAAGMVFGTAPYMAPEQVRGEPTDARTDLFALGILLYELSTGRRPFKGPTFADVSSAILRDAPEPPSALRPELPGELERIIARCLEKLPGDRFQRAIEVRNALRTAQGTLERTMAAPKSPASEVPSIAVLPFVNMGRDEENDYFSDGLTEELIGVLARIRGLRVAARSSSFALRGKDIAVADVGRTLNVSTVLEGSVRKAGKRVRIAVQLIKVSDGFHLWAETYDRTLEDIFAVQDDIAQSVVKELRTTLLGAEPDSRASGEARAEVAAAAQGRSLNPEAHRLYLQGRYFVDRFTDEDLVRGIEYLERALALEPENARAWAQLSVAHGHRASYGWTPVAEGFEAARAAARRAQSLAPDLADGYAAMARIESNYDFDFRNARLSTGRALDLAPENSEVLIAAAVSAVQVGLVDEALIHCRRAVEIDPLSSVCVLRLGALCRLAGLLDESDRACRKGLELSPKRIVARFLLALNHVARGELDSALAEIRLEPAPYARMAGLSIVHRARGEETEAVAAVRQLESDFADDAAYQLAAVYADRHENDDAFRWLDHAWLQRDPGLTMTMTEPLFRPLHPDPRWPAFLGRIGLGQYLRRA